MATLMPMSRRRMRRGATALADGMGLLADAGVAAIDEEHEQDDQAVEDLLAGGSDADDLFFNHLAGAERPALAANGTRPWRAAFATTSTGS